MGSPEDIADVLRLHGVGAWFGDRYVGVEVEPDVHVVSDLERRIASIYDLEIDVQLTHPIAEHPQGMPDYERWLREVNSAKEAWRRFRGVPPG